MQWLPAPELDACLFRPHLPSVLHGARPSPAPHRAPHRSLAPALRALRPDRRPQRERPRHARRARRRPGAAAGHPPPRVSERARASETTAARCSPSGSSGRTRGSATRSRRCGRPGTRGSSSRATRSSRSSRTALRPNGLDVEWRLGYLAQPEIDRAFGDATVAVFPYRPELDQSGALLRALGAGVPAVAYDVGGIAEPVRRFGAGRVVPAGDVAGLAAARARAPLRRRRARAGARGRAASARGADLGRSRAGAPRAVRGDHVRLRARPVPRRDRAPARALRRGRGATCSRTCRDEAPPLRARRPRGPRGGVRRLQSTSSRRRPRRSPTCATGSRRTLDEDAAETYEDSFNRAVRKRWPELGLEIENR